MQFLRVYFLCPWHSPSCQEYGQTTTYVTWLGEYCGGQHTQWQFRLPWLHYLMYACTHISVLLDWLQAGTIINLQMWMILKRIDCLLANAHNPLLNGGRLWELSVKAQSTDTTDSWSTKGKPIIWRTHTGTYVHTSTYSIELIRSFICYNYVSIPWQLPRFVIAHALL